ncbi:right-handed parallel beta-helix repeat-containing protein [Primorskyibacter sp. S187A]|uniref:right-handed parallel beta-helix repeat-containing protein n=1 Tax=Primorskyibacter sp. S187A TaxID=3415130 RepID=UPI003C7CC2CC
MFTTEPQSSFAAHSNAHVIVSSSEELEEAVEALSGTGGTIYLKASDVPYDIDIRDLESSAGEAIRITSHDPENEAVVSGVYVDNASYLSIDGLTVDASEAEEERADWLPDIFVRDSDNIALTDLKMEGTAEGMLDKTGDVDKAANAIRVTGSEDVLISDNEISHYFHAVSIAGVENVAVTGNDIYALQGDGIRGGGVKDVLVGNNHIHDLLGSSNDINHPDMIQFWTKWPVGVTNENITISDNILDTGTGMAAQGILVQNEAYFSKGDPLEGVLAKGLTITNNIVHTGVHHGIAVGSYQDVQIHDNTVLWNEGSGLVLNTGEEPVSTAPWILVRGSPDTEMTGNVALSITLDETDLHEDNYALDYTNSAAANYAYDHVIGLSPFGTDDLRDLQFRPDSALNGTMGSSYSTWQASDEPVDPVVITSNVTEDRAALEFSAEFSTVDGQLIDTDEGDYIWTFDDGVVLEGPSVIRAFDQENGPFEVRLDIQLPDGRTASEEYMFEAGTNDLFMMDFDDLNATFPTLSTNLVDPQGTADDVDGVLTLDGTTHFQISNNEAEMGNLETLSVSVDFKPDDFNEQDGWLLYWPNGVNIRITEEQGIWATIKTDQGTYEMRSADGALSEGQWSTINVQFDGPANKLSLRLDGEYVDQTEAFGTVFANTHPLVLGEPHQDRSALGEVDNLELSSPRSAMYDGTEDTGARTDDDSPFDIENPDRDFEPDAPTDTGGSPRMDPDPNGDPRDDDREDEDRGDEDRGDDDRGGRSDRPATEERDDPSSVNTPDDRDTSEDQGNEASEDDTGEAPASPPQIDVNTPASDPGLMAPPVTTEVISPEIPAVAAPGFRPAPDPSGSEPLDATMQEASAANGASPAQATGLSGSQATIEDLFEMDTWQFNPPEDPQLTQPDPTIMMTASGVPIASASSQDSAFFFDILNSDGTSDDMRDVRFDEESREDQMEEWLVL